MTFYEGTKKLFKTDKYSDMVISCNGTRIPVHRAVVCSQSPFFEAAANVGLTETRTGVIDLPDDDPTALEQFLSNLYCGYYPDVIFGNPQEPHVTSQYNTRETNDKLRRGCTMIHGPHAPNDKSDNAAMDRFYRSNTWSVHKDSGNLIEGITEALWIYIMGDKYHLPTARLVAVYRINLCFEMLFDVNDLDSTTIAELVGLIDELYTNTRIDADSHCTVRYAFCSALHGAARSNQLLRAKLQLATKQISELHPDFKQYMAQGV